MKAYINIKNYSDLHSHQTLNKRIWLMKRERKHNSIHHFSFGERFDEKMLRLHYFGGQRVILHILQFIEFSPFIKSAGKATEVNITIRKLAGRTSGLPTDKEKNMLPAKRERHPKAADTAAGFWETKSHNFLGCFLHAPLKPMLKTP